MEARVFVDKSIRRISSSCRKPSIVWVLCDLTLLSIKRMSGREIDQKNIRMDLRTSFLWWRYPHQRRSGVYYCSAWYRSRWGFLCPQRELFSLRWKDNRTGGSNLSSDSSRITLWSETELMSEKNTPPFMVCSRMVCSAPRQTGCLVGYTQKEAYHWILGVKGAW